MTYITVFISVFQKVSLYSSFEQLSRLIRIYYEAPIWVPRITYGVRYFMHMTLGTAANFFVGTTNTALPAGGVVSPGTGTATGAANQAVFTRAATFRRVLSTALSGYELRPSITVLNR